MASMAAAIAASRSVVMSGNRPLDERERQRLSYLASLSPMARKILQDKERVRQRYGPEWARLPPAQQDAIIDRCLVGPPAPGAPEPPGPRAPPGQKLVRFGDEDITWQDEHSAPFSWETREPSGEPRPLAPRPAPGAKSCGPDEEAAFWKVNAERARGGGPEAEFPSLTPSQIKSMEKGEKVLPAGCRPEPAPRDREAPGPVQAGCPGASGEGPPPEPGAKPPAPEAGPTDGETATDELFPEPGAAQVSGSNVILKTGFDFLDNW
ncbi:uncharacterized protein C1orf198 homolog isoform X2 [Pipistrellus kuhlii]|uniref:uncharacterized protein C1orf198 homolog isoform X2 n=1 Tax=Pipistrellus kuhlii TaxID=59472 RepID=UPI001E2732D8|nr:uncharacterized protein C1orf198 homolog isoform X2 [Pipistrellus kuhlii]